MYHVRYTIGRKVITTPAFQSRDRALAHAAHLRGMGFGSAVAVKGEA